MKKINYDDNIENVLLYSLINNPSLLDILDLKEDIFYHPNSLLAYKTLLKMKNEEQEINLISFTSNFTDVNGKVFPIVDQIESHRDVSSSFIDTYLGRLNREALKRKISITYEQNHDDPEVCIQKIKDLELEIKEKSPSSIGDYIGDYEAEYLEKKKIKQEGGSIHLITGFDKLDERCGLSPGNLVIIAARTSVGKTAFSLNIGLNASFFNQNVLFFSAEMTVDELMNRVLGQLTSTSSTKFKHAEADEALRFGKREMEGCKDNLYLIEASQMTSSDICRISEKFSYEKKVDCVIVDYLQYLKDPLERGTTNNDRVGNITRNLKRLAMKLKCPVIALSQVNRQSSGIPEVSNLRDSGNIEQDADIILILHREDRESVKADLVIAKNRQGEVFRTVLNYNPRITKFYE